MYIYTDNTYIYKRSNHMDLVGHDFLTLLDFTPAEIGGLLDLAAELKAKKRRAFPTIRCAAKTWR